MRRAPITMSKALISSLALGVPLVIAFHDTGFAEASAKGTGFCRTRGRRRVVRTSRQPTYVSPDGELRASVIPVGVSLYATPDIESRVVIRSGKGDTLTSKDYSSPRGANGYYVDEAKWTPELAVLRLQHGLVRRSFAVVVPDDGVQPTEKGDRQARHDWWQAISVGKLSNRRPTPLTVSTWKQPGDLDHPVKLTVDLEKAFAQLPASVN